MKKRAPAYLTFLLLTFLVGLPACTGSAVQTAATPTGSLEPVVTSSPIPTASPTPLAEIDLSDIKLPAGIELTFWHPWSGALAGLMEEMVASFNQTNQWGIIVNMEVHADELVLMQDMEEAITAGTLPDVVAAPSAYLKSWYWQGLPVQDLSGYVSSPDWGLDRAQRDAFLPVFWSDDLVDKVRLGTPAYRDGHFLFYNQSWARELGFDNYPETSADFQQQACAAANANLTDALVENNGTGGWLYDTQPLALLAWLRAFNGDEMIRSDGEITFEGLGSQTALEYLFDLYTQDCAWTGKQSTPFQYFAQRYSLFYSGDSQDIFTQETVDQQSGNADDWMLIPYPSDNYRPVVYVDGDSYAILHQDDDQTLAAWLFLRYLLDTQNQIKVIQATGSLPLSTTTIGKLTDFRQEHPVWDQALQYLALAQSIPSTPGWLDSESVLSDMAWQLKFTAAKENIPAILSEAERIIQGN